MSLIIPCATIIEAGITIVLALYHLLMNYGDCTGAYKRIEDWV